MDLELQSPQSTTENDAYKRMMQRVSASMKNIPNNLSISPPPPPADKTQENIQLAIQTLVNVREASNKSQIADPVAEGDTLTPKTKHQFKLVQPAYSSAFDQVAYSSNDSSVDNDIVEAMSPAKAGVRNIDYELRDILHPDTFKHASPLKINAFKNPDLPFDDETKLNEYTRAHEPITHNPELLQHSRQKSLLEIHSEDIDNLCIRSNSPALYSKNNSNNNSFHGGYSGSGSDTDVHPPHYHRVDSDYNSDFDNHSQLLHPPTVDAFSGFTHIHPNPRILVQSSNPPSSKQIARKKYKKLTYTDVAKSLSHYYDDYNKYSNEMDVLITFIRGQKHLFLQSANVTAFKLYTMLFLALCITAFVSVVTPFIENYTWNVVLITSCNAGATLVISMTRYWNFEFSNNAYTFLSNNYDKLEHSLEIANNKLAFIDNEQDQSKIVLDKIKEMEFKIGEMKDVFQATIPAEVVMLFPVISHVNIFSFIKKMESHKRNLIFKYRDIKNEINYHMYKLNQHADWEIDENVITVEKKRILYLNAIKDRIKSELINYKEAYNQIDFLFTKEIQFAEKHVNTVYALPLYNWWYGKPKYLEMSRYSNPVIQEYLNLIIDNDGHFQSPTNSHTLPDMADIV